MVFFFAQVNFTGKVLECSRWMLSKIAFRSAGKPVLMSAAGSWHGKCNLKGVVHETVSFLFLVVQLVYNLACAALLICHVQCQQVERSFICKGSHNPHVPVFILTLLRRSPQREGCCGTSDRTGRRIVLTGIGRSPTKLAILLCLICYI